MAIVKSLFKYSAALKQYLDRDSLSDKTHQQFAPIRYIGDPTEIYLA